ncbi:hypothetical protein pipiens_009795 [Culex pipiens pipiens]|uniref:Uncharacterized protein n=1 Tax=Culex pipiens pipiens TaxID=38569 RepID=A0ABD1DCJ4_CULPP
MRLPVLIVIYLVGLCCASKANKDPVKEQQSGLSNDPSSNNKTDGFRRKVIVNQVIHDIPVRQTYNTDNCQTNDATNEHDYNENNNTTNHDATFNTTYDNVNNRIDNAKTINNGDDFYSVATPAALVVQVPTTQSTSDQTSTTTVVYDYGQDYSDLEGFTDFLEESSTTVQPSPTTTPQPTTTAQVDVATTDSDANGKRASPTESTTTEANYLADYGLGAPIFGGESYDAWWLDGNPADAGGGSDAGIVQGGPLNKESVGGKGVANNKEKEPESERTPSEEVFGNGGGAPYEVKKQETDYGGPPKIKPADDWHEGHRAPQNKEHANDDGSEKKEKDKNEPSKPTTMNSKTVLLLLGTACLFALIHVSAGEDAPGTAQDAATNGKPGRSPAGNKPFGRPGPGGGKSFDFRKEVEQIFDEFKVETGTRDKILERIKQRMEQLHAKGGFRKRGGKGKGKEKRQ